MTRSTCFLAALTLCTALSGPAMAADSASFELRFAGVAPQTGAIMASVFDSEAAYAGGKPVRSVRIPATGAEVSATIEGLPPGRYAVKAFHDVDGDGRMGTNPFGIPLEPYAFSNDALVNMGPPAWAATAFDVSAGHVAHTITFPKPVQ